MKQWYQDRMYARVIRMDGRVDRVQLDCMEDCGTLIASFPEQADWTDIRTVEFAPEMGQNKAGQDGYYIMTDEWFGQYNYQVVVNRKYLTPEQLEMLTQEPIHLKPWDPMGSLA